MKVKQILGIALAGVVSMGAVLGSRMPVYAASEDWIKVDVDSNGNKQPSVSLDTDGTDEWWHMSFGYTVQPNYKYALRFCNDWTKEWGKSADRYGYYDFVYHNLSMAGQWEAGTDTTSLYPYALEDVVDILANYDTAQDKHTIPAGEEMFIHGRNDIDKWEDVLATGYIMVYNQNNNLVDTFPLQSQPVDNTDTTVPVTEPADTIPAVENTADMPVVTDTITNIQPVQTSDNSVSVEAVAREVIKGKWGVGKERRIRLETAGYDYAEVQKKVSVMMKQAS
ncbi:MAG: hypothetical protein K2N34_10525 [Lachnospiraceae bacterium]|nr:hypothetical protein [Lachnospiraceae bacterium]